ncbi:MAG: serine hydrolase [Ferruginibacter sp.]|nr:serine hydrolase [Ferruginibacter sp.]
MFLKNPPGSFLLLVMVFLSSCATTKKVPVPVVDTAVVVTAPVPVDSTRTDAFLEDLLKQYPQYFDSILQKRKDWNVQLIYTQIDKGANGIAALKNYYFNLNGARYFYPASTVKFPVSMLALQKLNELKIKGVDRNTTMITEQAFSGQTPVYNDPTTPDGKPTIAQYIKKILMVSDNDAFNRLYEFLGREYINEQLHKKGYGDVQVLHRLSIPLSREENMHTNPLKFLGPQNNIIYDQPMQYDTSQYVQRNDSIGRGYYKAGQLVNEPMDFSTKNRISLEDLHIILISLVFPNKVPGAQRFSLTKEDRDFLLKYMSQLPTESSFPPYSADTVNYWPAYCKFLLFGSEKGALPKNIRIFNKVGDAYGQLTDAAYIVDLDKKIEFFLSATIYCNKDGILNDDLYDYKTIGLPFMKHLGQVIYEHELKRKRKNIPDLSGLIFDYDTPNH